MTQAGGNGYKDDANPDDITTYEPAYAPEDDTEVVGWWTDDPDNEDGGEFFPNHPLDDDDEPTSN